MQSGLCGTYFEKYCVRRAIQMLRKLSLGEKQISLCTLEMRVEKALPGRRTTEKRLGGGWFWWCGQRHIPKVPILSSGFPQTVRNWPESRTFKFPELFPPKPHCKSVPSKMMWILSLGRPKLAPSSPILLYLRILSTEYYKTRSIMWKNGAAAVNWLLWSLYGHCGWDPLEACIVKSYRLEKNALFSYAWSISWQEKQRAFLLA